MPSSGATSWRARIADYRFTALLIALLALVIAPLLVGDQRSAAFRIVSFGVLLLGVLSVLEHRRTSKIAIFLGSLAAAAQLTAFLRGAQFLPELRFVALVAFFGFVASVIVVEVLRSDVITWDKIQGAVCAYLLFGVAWAVLYGWVGAHDPNAFGGAVEGAGDGEPMIYFSFVTLTTLGYGDITPVHQTARTLAWLEAVFGQIYLVVLVAHLVSRQLKHSER